MGAASDRLLSLRPVTFRYKEAFADGEQPMQYGLIAEEVAEVFPELVVYADDGSPETVKYRLLSALLLNELQKQYQVNQRQEAELAGVTTQAAEMAAIRIEIAEIRSLKARLARLEAATPSPVPVAGIQ